MNFASAFISLQMGEKIRRSHWYNYWKLKDNKVMIHKWNGEIINSLDTKDLLYILSNCACDDWEIRKDR